MATDRLLTKKPRRFTGITVTSAQRFLSGIVLDRQTRLALTIWAAAIITQLVLGFISYRLLPSQIPLYYSRPWGIAQLASREYLWILPLGSFLLGLLNLGLSLSLKEEDFFLAHTLVWGASGVALLALLAQVNIIYLIRT